jgi:hypothetical protein
VGGAGVVWTALFACAEYLDPPLARRGGGFAEVRQVLARRTALALGFGLRSLFSVGPAPEPVPFRLPSWPGLSCTVRWFQQEPCLEGPIPGG